MLCSTIARAKASPAINVQGKRRRTSGQEEARAFTTSNVDAFCANSADDKPPDTASSAHMAAAESWYDQPIWLSSLKNIAVRKSSDLRFHNRTGGHGRPKARKGSHMDVILPKFRTHPAQDTDLPRARRTALPRNATRPLVGRARTLQHSRFTPPASSASAARSTHRRTPRTSTGSSRCSRCASS